MKYRDAVASLIIHDVVDADAGRYTAEASNQYGYVATSAAVKVKGKLKNLHLQSLQQTHI